MIQNNSDNAKSWQTRVEGGTAYIAETINIGQTQLPASSTGIPCNITQRGAVQFVGRDDELEKLHTLLYPDNYITVSAISGMGGIGKTELALQYALRHYQLGTYSGGVCWLQARNTLGYDAPSYSAQFADTSYVGTQIVSFARTQFQLNPPEALTLPDQVAFCWRHWRQGKVLVVLDDVTNYEAIRPYLPPVESRFKVLLTTRLQLGQSVRKLEIEVLKEKAALELLVALVEKPRVQQQLEAAKALCYWLGYLPLGLELVGRYLARRQELSLAEMQQRLTAKRLEHRAMRTPEPGMTAERGVEAAFELSWLALDETAKQLGGMLSLFALSSIPWTLAEVVIPKEDREAWEEARDEELLNLHLLQRTGNGTYQLHQLVREFLREKLELSSWVNDLKQRFVQAIGSVAEKVPRSPTNDDIVEFAVSIPHVVEVATTLRDFLSDEDFSKPFVGLGRFYIGQGLYDKAERWYKECLIASQSRFGNEKLEVAASLNNLAFLYRYKGQYNDATKLFRQALDLSERLLGKDHTDVAITLNNLALVYCDQGRFDEAELCLQKALEIQEKCSEAKFRSMKATTLNNLSYCYFSLGNHKKAESLLREVLEIRKQCFGESHPDVAESLNNLAFLYKEQGDFRKAEFEFIKALKLRRSLLGEQHPDTANSLQNLGVLYAEQGRYQEAKRLVEQALVILEERLGSKHRHTVSARLSLRDICDDLELSNSRNRYRR